MKKFNDLVSTDVDFTDLKSKINELEIKIANSPYTLDESKQANEEFERLFLKMRNMKEGETLTEAEKTQFNLVNRAMSLQSDVETLKRFNETLTLPLVMVKTDFIISEKRITSPAGFGVDSGVYVQNEIMIGTNNRKPKPPACNFELGLYDCRSYEEQKANPLK